MSQSSDQNSVEENSRIVPAFGGIVSAIVAAVTSKPNWVEKAKDRTIVQRWIAELLEDPDVGQVSGLTPVELDRVATSTIQALLNDAKISADRDPYDAESVDPWSAGRPLKLNVDCSSLSFHCRCKCAMCSEGRWAYVKPHDSDANGDDDDDDDDDFDSDTADLTERVRKCLCYPRHRERLVAARRAYLERATVRVPAPPTPGAATQAMMRAFAAAESAADPANPLLWHPGTGEQVLDVVHPSLGCVVRFDSDSETKEGCGATCLWPRTTFDVAHSADGEVAGVALPVGETIHGCAAGSTLEQALVGLANEALPLLQQVMRTDVVVQQVPTPNPNNLRPWELRRQPKQPPLPPFAFGKNVRLIVKASSTRVCASKPTFPAGSWHLEGVPEDKIVATAIHYVPYEDEAKGAIERGTNLAFRVSVDGEVGYPQDGTTWLQVHHGFEAFQGDHYDRLFRTECPLGSLPTDPGSWLCFPNILQHQVGEVRLGRGEEAWRRIVVFWLVAADAPELPPSHAAQASTAELRAYRELLMVERKYSVATEAKIFEKEVSLCEH